MKKIACFLLFLPLLTVACATSEESDQAAITGLIESDPVFAESVTDSAGTEEAGTLGLVAQPQMAFLGTVLFWHRGNVIPTGRDVDIAILGDTALAEVVHHFSGVLFVNHLFHGTPALWQKPFQDTATRHARFVKEPNGWVLTHASPLEVAMADTARQTVHIIGVKASVGDTTVWETSDPAALLTVTSALAHLDSHSHVLVEATVEDRSTFGSPSPKVFLHRPGILGRVRDPMFNDASHGDRFAGDSIFSRSYTVGTIPGVRHAAVDILDGASLAIEAGSYNSGAWGIPYIVQ